MKGRDEKDEKRPKTDTLTGSGSCPGSWLCQRTVRDRRGGKERESEKNPDYQPKEKTVTLNKGQTLQLKIKVTPKNAKNKKVTYKSSNKKIASVTSKGKIKGIKKGTATITVTAKDKSKKKGKA